MSKDSLIFVNFSCFGKIYLLRRFLVSKRCKKSSNGLLHQLVRLFYTMQNILNCLLRCLGFCNRIPL